MRSQGKKVGREGRVRSQGEKSGLVDRVIIIHPNSTNIFLSLVMCHQNSATSLHRSVGDFVLFCRTVKRAV